jgi:hypothetical protein
MQAAGIRYWARTLALRADQGVAPQRLATVRAHIEQVRQVLASGGHVDLGTDEPQPDADPVDAAARHLDEALGALVAERAGAVPEDVAVPVG